MIYRYFMTIVILIVFAGGCHSDAQHEKTDEKLQIGLKAKHNPEDDSGFVTDTVNYPEKFSINYPQDWDVINDPQIIYGAKMNCDSGSRFCPNFIITVIKKRQGLTIEQYGQALNEGQSIQVTNLSTLKTSKGILNNGNIQTLTFEQKYEWNDLTLGGISRLFLKKGNHHVILITFLAEWEKEDSYFIYQDFFTQILESIKFL